MFMVESFNNLETEQFRIRMRPQAIKIYKQIWPGCQIEDLRDQAGNVHILDKEFGIDTLITFSSGQWISIQEKYRRYNTWNKYRDFTQEYMNGAGTQNEAHGEWFHLGAQVYFVGWADINETYFPYWFLMDIAKYKLIIESYGGLDKVGKLKQNKKHGRASFYGIPIKIIKPAFLITYNDLR